MLLSHCGGDTKFALSLGELQKADIVIDSSRPTRSLPDTEKQRLPQILSKI